MQAVKWSIWCILLVALSGCQSMGNLRLPQTPRQKLLGYHGRVEPFTQPIILRYHKVPAFRYDYRQKVLFGATRKNLFLSGKGSIQAGQGVLRAELAVHHITIDKDHLASHDAAPLVRSEELIDPRGIVKHFILDTEPLQRQGWHIPRKGTPRFQEFSYPFKQLIMIFPRQGITMGTPIKGWHSGEKPFLDLAGRILPNGAVTRDTLRTQALGITTMNGRKHLVLRMTGEYRVRQGKDFVALEVNGYSLIDTNSDLATTSVLQVHISVFKANKHLPGYEATIRRSIVPVDSHGQ